MYKPLQDHDQSKLISSAVTYMARTFKETTPQKQDFIKKHETAMMCNHHFLLPFFNYITVSRISTFFPVQKFTILH